MFVHHGTFVSSRIAGRDELAGSDVIVVHRLLKGAGAVEARGNGFALFTAAAVDALGLDADALQLRAGAEEIEHLGRVDTFTLDLEARWQDEGTMRRLETSPTPPSLAFDIEATFSADPSVIWERDLTSPAPPPNSSWQEGPIAKNRGDELAAGAAGRRNHGAVRDRTAGKTPSTRRSSNDWQPTYDPRNRVAAWPSRACGPVAATADLDPRPPESGTRLRLRWASDHHHGDLRPDGRAGVRADGVRAHIGHDRLGTRCRATGGLRAAGPDR